MAQTLINDFNAHTEGWCIYDYEADAAGKQDNRFPPVTWERSGGIEDSGYVWADDSRWTIDTPERPHSILAFIIYRRWIGGGSLDLRDADISVYLRGVDLDLKGAECYFWVNKPGTRWHLTKSPLYVSTDGWASQPNTFELTNDESLWHRSWQPKKASLDEVLANCISYGFSFVGFTEKVTGRFCMDELRIAMQH